MSPSATKQQNRSSSVVDGEPVTPVKTAPALVSTARLLHCTDMPDFMIDVNGIFAFDPSLNSVRRGVPG
jgi:hypothetical protein